MAANLRYDPPMSKPLPLLFSRLWDAALLYLGRYEASTHKVRNLLRRRITRWARRDDVEPDPAAGEVIEAVIAKLQQSGLLDDGRYAETKALSLARGGRSRRAIRAYLTQSGITPDLTQSLLEKMEDEAVPGCDPDLAAALILARKKRWGRFRAAPMRAEKRDRDLAALGRAGFSWEVARRVVDEE